ncbi:MAG: hypothetical protein ACXWQO_13490 [Bdellovibrionota bacterium]
MIKAGIILGAILLSGAAQASQLNCTGNIAGYNLVLRASMSGARFTSSAHLVVSQGSTVLKNTTMRVTSSRFVAGRSLYFTASGTDGKIVVNAQFSGGRNYAGTVDASGPQGNISVSGVCSVR